MIDNMIEQIPAYLVAVQSTAVGFWNENEGAEKYDTDLAKKATKIGHNILARHGRLIPLERQDACGSGGG